MVQHLVADSAAVIHHLYKEPSFLRTRPDENMAFLTVFQAVYHGILHDGLNDQLRNHAARKFLRKLVIKAELSLKTDLLYLCIAVHELQFLLQCDKLGVGDTGP